MRARFVNEAFERKNKETAKRDLLFPGLKEWLRKHDINKYSFENGRLNINGVLSVYEEDIIDNILFGKVEIFNYTSWDSSKSPAELPWFPTEIKENLIWNVRNSKSLKGLPEKINGFCSLNFSGDSLEGSPEYVKKSFEVFNPKLKTMKGAPEYIGGNFDLGNTEIVSLEGCPKKIDGKFICYGPLGKKLGKNPEKKIREVCDIGGEIYLFSAKYAQNKEYRKNYKDYGGPLPKRATHVVKNKGNQYTYYSRGYKLWHILKYIEKENKKGNYPSYTDIQRYNYEMNYGKGSYNKYSKLSDNEIEKVIKKLPWYINNPSRVVTKEAIRDMRHVNRGFGSTNMLDTGSIGSKIRKIDLGNKKGYTVNGLGQEYLEDNKHLFSKKEH